MDTTAAPRLFGRDFTAYWLGFALGAVGDALTYVALPFLVLHLGGSGTALATVVLLGSVPRFAGPLLGALADRIPLRLPLALGAAVRAALVGTLAALALNGALALWMVFLVAPVSALVTIFTVAAGNVALPRMVPGERLGQANALMQGATMGVPMVGLGAGGALVAGIGPASTLLLAVPCLVGLSLGLALVRFPRGAGHARPPFVRDLVAGVQVLTGLPALQLLLIATLVLNAALNLLNVLMPLVMERSGHGAAGYGTFEALVSGGALLGIAAVTVLARRVPERVLVTISQTTVAIGFAVLAVGALVPTLGGGAVIGMGLGLGEVAAITLLQRQVPDGHRGKVLGLVLPANALGLSLGALVGGAVASSPSYALAFLGAGTLVAALALTWSVLSRRAELHVEMPAEAA